MRGDALLADAGEEVVDVGATGGAHSSAEEDVKIPVSVVALQGVQASTVFCSCEEEMALRIWVQVRGRHGKSHRGRGWIVFAIESGESGQTAVDGDVVRACNEAGEFEVVQGAGLGEVERHSQE